MPAPRIARTIHRPARQKREGDSAVHLADIRTLFCCICGSRPVHAHHLLRIGEQLPRGMSRKSEDRWAVPLCSTHHMALHGAGDEEAYLASLGIDGRSLARALWANRGDIEGMERVAFRCRQRMAL